GGQVAPRPAHRRSTEARRQDRGRQGARLPGAPAVVVQVRGGLASPPARGESLRAGGRAARGRRLAAGDGKPDRMRYDRPDGRSRPEVAPASARPGPVHIHEDSVTRPRALPTRPAAGPWISPSSSTPC